MLTEVVQRLRKRVNAADGAGYPLQQLPTQLWAHLHALTDYQVWVCYRIATHQLNLYGPGREQDSTCTRYATCRGRHEGIIHILYDCEGAAKCWAYIVAHWARMDVKPAQLSAYKAAVLSRTAPDLPPGVREEIGRLFLDTAEEIRSAWVRIWWIACSICFATQYVQRK